jgi:hypothetical protein
VPAKAETLWEQYLALPTPENAKKVVSIEYTKGAIPDDYGYWAPDLLILQNQILGGDKESFRLAYRLRQNSDGGLLEDLTAILGRSIRPKPNMFLSEMLMLNPDSRALRSILRMPGLEYVDRRQAKNYELKMRKAAITSVSNEKLSSIKTKCLQLMDN